VTIILFDNFLEQVKLYVSRITDGNHLLNADIDFGAARNIMMEKKFVEVDEIELEPIPVEDSDEEKMPPMDVSGNTLEALLFSGDAKPGGL
jgi:histone deacetylase complex regulatory component SIN3